MYPTIQGQYIRCVIKSLNINKLAFFIVLLMVDLYWFIEKYYLQLSLQISNLLSIMAPKIQKILAEKQVKPYCPIFS